MSEIDDLIQVYLDHKADIAELQGAFDKYYESLPVDERGRIASDLVLFRAHSDKARAKLIDSGVDPDGLGFHPVIYLALAVAAAAVLLGGGALIMMLQNDREKMKIDYDLVMKYGPDVIESKPDDAPAAAAAGFGIGTILGAAAVAWFLLKS